MAIMLDLIVHRAPYQTEFGFACQQLCCSKTAFAVPSGEPSLIFIRIMMLLCLEFIVLSDIRSKNMQPTNALLGHRGTIASPLAHFHPHKVWIEKTSHALLATRD